MKKFLTKKEACKQLKEFEPTKVISYEDSVALASIRVCIAAEDMGLNLWGTSVEEARPIFRKPEEPVENSSDLVIENYEAYKLCLAEAYEKLKVS